MAGLFESLFGGGATAYGLNNLLGDLTSQRADVANRLGQIETNVGATGGFQPWGVTSRIGSSIMDGGGNMTNTLAPEMAAYADSMRGLSQSAATRSNTMDPTMAARAGVAYDGSQTAMARSLQDPYGRETDVYNRIRAMQQPEEQRQLDSMQAGLFGSGRGGMATAGYGGSPEEFAYNKARSEAMNQASLQAMGQAQSEMMNQANMATSFGQLGGNTYQAGLQEQQIGGQLAGLFGGLMQEPENQLLAQGQLGVQGGQVMNKAQNDLAGLIAQLGIGGLTTDVNYANVIGGTYGKMAEAAGSAASGAGGWLDSILS